MVSEASSSESACADESSLARATERMFTEAYDARVWGPGVGMWLSGFIRDGYGHRSSAGGPWHPRPLLLLAVGLGDP